MLSAHDVATIRSAEQPLIASLPDDGLMRRAATGLAGAIVELLGRSYGRRVVLLVGSGDNGGDALYAGALLCRRGVQVYAVLLGKTTHPRALACFSEAGGRVGEPAGAVDLVVDGIAGIGGRGGLRPEAAELLQRWETALVVAVDLPTGVNADAGTVHESHVRADLTVTFGTLRHAHLVEPAASACGVVEVVELGLGLPTANLRALQPADVSELWPWPTRFSHKYTRGVVGIRAGSAPYPGAAVLAVGGALAGPAGMVRYTGSETEAVRSAHPEVVGPGEVQAWVVGPGGGVGSANELGEYLAQAPSVVDASALAYAPQALSTATSAERRGVVLTPHAGELARLLGTDRAQIEHAPLQYCAEAARDFGCTVLLKGPRTVICSPSGVTWVTCVGPAHLATAGAGDVLAGLIGSLLAAGLAGEVAAALGSVVHGAAAQTAGGPLVASELPGLIRAYLRAVRASVDGSAPSALADNRADGRAPAAKIGT